MNVAVTGIGLWARGITSLADFAAARRDEFAGLDEAGFDGPRAAAIPARERRRAGLAINLCVEVAHQACEVAGIDKSSVPSVFASAMGDTAITDYMCRKLAGADKLLSPTQFHNSVHNAPACYWAISAANRAPNTFIGGFLESFGAAFFEASSQAIGHGGPVLLVGYDVATAPPLDDVAAIAETLAVALVVTPARRARWSQVLSAMAAEVRFVAEPACPPRPRAPFLVRLAAANPIGGALALLEQCVSGDQRTLRFPANARAHVELRFESMP